MTAERPFEQRPPAPGAATGLFARPVKRVLRKLMRWYVEPVAAQQRTFNLAILRLVDELTERTAADVERLERRSRRWKSASPRVAPTERMRIAVCAPQVPFERGGTEILVETLVEQLRGRDHEVELVRVPFKWYPGARPLREALVWRLVDLEEAHGRPIDLVIATKFPSYAIRHPNKVVWLVHQFRQAYELDRTELGQFGERPVRPCDRPGDPRLDRTTLGEARRLFAISQQRGRPAPALDGARG